MLVYGLKTLVRFWTIAEEKCLNIFLKLNTKDKDKITGERTCVALIRRWSIFNVLALPRDINIWSVSLKAHF